MTGIMTFHIWAEFSENSYLYSIASKRSMIRLNLVHNAYQFKNVFSTILTDNIEPMIDRHEVNVLHTVMVK